MTTAHGTRHFGLWGLPVCPIVIEHELATLDGIAGEVLEGFQALSRGGLEVGGLLFGTSDDGRLRITGFEPVACEHAFGPSFKLSHHDKQALEEQLRKHAALAASMSRVVVGWYHSHTRSELAFSAEDAELHDRFFPETWQVALILRPERDLSIGARFFFREPDGAGEHTLRPYEPFSLEYQNGKPQSAAGSPRDSVSRPRTSPEEAPGGPLPASKPAVTLRPKPRGMAPPPEPLEAADRQRTLFWTGIVAIVLICVFPGIATAFPNLVMGAPK